MTEIFNSVHYDFTLLGLPRAATAFLGLLVPLILYFRNRQSRVHQLYLLVVIPAFVWQFGYAWMIQTHDYSIALFWSGVGRVGTYFIPSTIYAFSVFHTNSIKQFPLVVAAFVASLVMALNVYHPALFSHLHDYSWGYYGIHGPWHRVQLLFTALAGFGLYYNLIHDFRTTRSQNQRKLDWFFMVAFAGAYVGAFEFLPGYGFDVRPVGFFAVSFWSLLMLWAILKHRAIDLESIITHTFSYLALSAIVFLLYVGLISLAKGILVGVVDWRQILAAGLALLSIFPIADYFRGKIQGLIKKSFHRHRLTDQATLSEFTEHLSELNNSKLLLQDLVATLLKTTGVTHAGVFLRSDDRSCYVLREARGTEASVFSVPGDHRVMLWLKSHNRVLVKDSLVHDGDFPEMLEPAVSLMESLKASLLVPLAVSGDLIGFLSLGNRVTGVPFDTSDVELLRIVGKNAAVAVSNALLFEELSEKNLTLIRIDREKESFLANTSHELRTPLHGIMGIAEALIEDPDGKLNERQLHHVHMIHESGKALAELVEKLLDLQRLESQQADFEIVPVAVKDVMAMVEPIIQGVLKKKRKVKLVLELDDVPKIYGDVRMLRQVLLNLMGNSAKFTESGSITVRAWRGNGPRGNRKEADEPDRYVTIAVSDTGIGIRPENREVIFERFRQADRSVSRQYGGTGLGLAIVQKIIEAHQGKIWVESEVRQGSTFYVSLPQFPFAVEPAKKNLIVPEQLASEPLGLHPMTADRLYNVPKTRDFVNLRKGGGERVLVIDDNPVNIEIVRTCLERQSYRVFSALTAQEGWEILFVENPDLVILDVMMPGFNGYEFCQRLRSQEAFKRTAVIMVTAKGTLEDKVYGLNVGADDYITKPFNKEELAARVNTFVRIKRMQDELEQMYKELKAISEITTEINQELELDRLLSMILDKVMDLVAAERGALFTKDADSPEINLRFSRGFSSQKRTEVHKAISQEIIRAVLVKGVPEVIADLSGQKGKYYLEKSGSIICLPLRVRDQVYGSLYLYSARVNQLNANLLRILIPLSQQLSSSIHNAKLYDLAVTDDLTRLYLKRHFYECLQLEIERSAKQPTKFSAIMIDIDHFKVFNDTYGHQIGDAVLVQVAELLQDSCRIADVAARYGGEEFIVLLRNTDVDEAQIFASRYRALVENYRLYHRGEKLQVTVSCGVCTFESPIDLTVDDIVGFADIELYKAKGAGRNCIKVNRPQIPRYAENPPPKEVV